MRSVAEADKPSRFKTEDPEVVATGRQLLITVLFGFCAGLVCGVGITVIVAAAVDGRTEREEQLISRAADAEKRLTESMQQGSTREAAYSEELKSVRATAQRLTEALAAKDTELADLHKVRRGSRVLGFTLEQAVAAVKKELSAVQDQTRQNMYRVAGGKAVLVGIPDNSPELIQLGIVGSSDQILDFGRTLFLILAKVERDAYGDRKEMARWFTDSVEFASRHESSSVRRQFGGHVVQLDSVDWGQGDDARMVMATISGTSE